MTSSTSFFLYFLFFIFYFYIPVKSQSPNVTQLALQLANSNWLKMTNNPVTWWQARSIYFNIVDQAYTVPSMVQYADAWVQGKQQIAQDVANGDIGSIGPVWDYLDAVRPNIQNDQVDALWVVMFISAVRLYSLEVNTCSNPWNDYCITTRQAVSTTAPCTRSLCVYQPSAPCLTRNNKTAQCESAQFLYDNQIWCPAYDTCRNYDWLSTDGVIFKKSFSSSSNEEIITIEKRKGFGSLPSIGLRLNDPILFNDGSQKKRKISWNLIKKSLRQGSKNKKRLLNSLFGKKQSSVCGWGVTSCSGCPYQVNSYFSSCVLYDTNGVEQCCVCGYEGYGILSSTIKKRR